MHATFSSSFLRGDERAVRFLPADFRDPLARKRAAEQAASRPIPVPPELYRALVEQEAALPPSAARQTSLEALGTPGTTVVVSGQQVGLFLGPLYTFYKAASAIAWARRIERETGVRCVPLFWLQTEDHDYEEIRSCHTFAPDGIPLHLELPPDAPDDGRGRASIAHRQLGDEVSALIATLGESLGGLPHAAEFLSLLSHHYRPGQTLGQAFAGLLGAIFADEGLLILDPRCPAIAGQAVPIYRQCIAEQAEIAAALRTRGADLGAAGFDEQVAVRPGTTLVFFHGSVTGPRYRLECTGGGFAVPGSAGRIYTQEELLALVSEEPLRFSTSALLRPLVQDLLLPTVAYVGGPGEINYFAQLQPLYEHFGGKQRIVQPLIVPRARFRCLEESTVSLLRRLGLGAAEVEVPRSELLLKVLGRSAAAAEGAIAPAELRAQLLGELPQRLDAMVAAEEGLRDAARRTRISVERNIGRFVARYERILSERDEVANGRVDRLQQFLFPVGVPQERYYSLPYFACKYGVAAFKQKVLDALLAADLSATPVRDLAL